MAPLSSGGGRTAPSYTPASTDYKTLKPGNKGRAVRDLQQRLIDLGYLSGKADGLVDVTAKTDKMTRTWKVAVGKAELPAEKVEEKGSFSPVTLAVPVVLLGGGAWWFMNRRKK